MRERRRSYGGEKRKGTRPASENVRDAGVEEREDSPREDASFSAGRERKRILRAPGGREWLGWGIAQCRREGGRQAAALEGGGGPQAGLRLRLSIPGATESCITWICCVPCPACAISGGSAHTYTYIFLDAVTTKFSHKKHIRRNITFPPFARHVHTPVRRSGTNTVERGRIRATSRASRE